MADALTANYQFVQPEVGASEDTWGTKLNDNWGDVDSILKGIEDTQAARGTMADLDAGTGGTEFRNNAENDTHYDGRYGRFASGDKILFQQTTAPTGWTKVTTGVDNRALRVVSGTVGSGGTRGFTEAFNENVNSGSTAPGTSTDGSHNHGGTNNHTLSTARIPSHDHSSVITSSTSTSNNSTGASRATISDGNPSAVYDPGSTANAGGGNSHSHGISNDGGHSHTVDAHTHTVNLDPLYLDVIVATKD